MAQNPPEIATIAPKKLPIGNAKGARKKDDEHMVVARAEVVDQRRRKLAVLSVSQDSEERMRSAKKRNPISDSESDEEPTVHLHSKSPQVKRNRFPVLKTEEEKELLSGIFAEWEDELELEELNREAVAVNSRNLNAIKRGVVPVVPDNLQLNTVAALSARTTLPCVYFCFV